MSIKQTKNAASKTSALWRGHTVGVCRTLTALDVCCITTTGSSVLLRRPRGNSACKRRQDAQQKTSGSDRTRRRVRDNSAEFQTSIFTIMRMFLFKKSSREGNHVDGLLPFSTEKRSSRANIDTQRRKEKREWHPENQVTNNIVGASCNTASTCTLQPKQRDTHQQSSIE